MRYFPAYQLRDVMEMYAISFFALLEEGYRQENVGLRTQAHIIMLPHLRKDARGKFLRQLDSAAQDLSDILRPSTSATGSVEQSEAELKRLLG